MRTSTFMPHIHVPKAASKSLHGQTGPWRSKGFTGARAKDGGNRAGAGFGVGQHPNVEFAEAQLNTVRAGSRNTGTAHADEPLQEAQLGLDFRQWPPFRPLRYATVHWLSAMTFGRDPRLPVSPREGETAADPSLTSPRVKSRAPH